MVMHHWQHHWRTSGGGYLRVSDASLAEAREAIPTNSVMHHQHWKMSGASPSWIYKFVHYYKTILKIVS